MVHLSRNTAQHISLLFLTNHLMTQNQDQNNSLAGHELADEKVAGVLPGVPMLQSG